MGSIGLALARGLFGVSHARCLGHKARERQDGFRSKLVPSEEAFASKIGIGGVELE